MSESVGQELAIILPIGALVLSLHFFQWRQNVAIENRLKQDRRESDERLHNEIVAVEERLTNRLDRTDGKVDSLIGEVGLVKGAVLGISVETASRESVPTN